MQTLFIPVVPDLAAELGVRPEDASWLITITLLAGAVATPSISSLADMFGKRRMLLMSLAALLVGSILGALVTSLTLLIVARALQGFAITLMPVAMSIMRDELPRERLASAVALMSASLGIGSALGLILSGFVFVNFGWQTLFWVSAAMALTMLLGVVATVPESPIRSGGRFDFPGAALLSGALLLLLLGITKGGHWGWTSTTTLYSFLGSALFFAAWVPWELRNRQPIVDLRSTVRRPVLLTNFASYLAGFAMYVNLLATTQVLQAPTSTGYGFGMTVLQAGIVLLPVALVMMVVAPIASAITKRFGARLTLIVGVTILAAGYLGRIFLMDSLWHVVLGSVIVSGGTILAFAAMPVLIMSSVPIDETAAANGLNAVLRGTGMATSSAAVAALLTGMTFVVGDSVYPTQAAFQYVYAAAAVGAILACAAAIGIPTRRHMSREVVEYAEIVESLGA